MTVLLHHRPISGRSTSRAGILRPSPPAVFKHPRPKATGQSGLWSMSCPFPLLGAQQTSLPVAADTHWQRSAFCAAGPGALTGSHSNPFQRDVPAASRGTGQPGDQPPGTKRRHSPPLPLTCDAGDGPSEAWAWGCGSLARLCCSLRAPLSGSFQGWGHRGSGGLLGGWRGSGGCWEALPPPLIRGKEAPSQLLLPLRILPEVSPAPGPGVGAQLCDRVPGPAGAHPSELPGVPVGPRGPG